MSLYDELRDREGGGADMPPAGGLYEELAAKERETEQPPAIDKADYYRKLNRAMALTDKPQADYYSEQYRAVEESPLNNPARNLDTRMWSGVNQVAGEMASGANAIATEILDVLAKTGNLSAGGYKAMMKVFSGAPLEDAVTEIGQTKPIPMPTDVAENVLGQRPGAPVMPPGIGQKLARTAGALIPAALGMAKVPGRDITRSPGQISELTGVGSASPASTVDEITAMAEQAAKRSDDVLMPTTIDAPVTVPQNKRLARELALKRGGGEAGAGYKLDEAGSVIPDPVQQKAINTGVRKGVVAMINNGTRGTKIRMKQMLDAVRGGMQDTKYKALNRPSNVIGDAMAARVKTIYKANRQAGEDIDRISKGFKSRPEPIDIRPAIVKLKDDLDDMDIILDTDTGKLDFKGSLLEGEGGKAEEAQKLMRNIVGRVFQGGRATAHNAHRAKRYIDSQVTFGSSPEGALKDDALRVVKRLRHNIDGILDAKYDDYRKANDTYSETINLLKEVQDLSGKKVDIKSDIGSEAMGLMSRKMLSNYQSGTQMRESVKNLTEMSRRLADKVGVDPRTLSDDIVELTAYEAELARMLPDAVPDRSLQGILAAEGARAGADIATGGKTAMIGAALKKGAEKFTSKTPEDIIKALEDLLKAQ
jgi:hypothetical protein